LLLIRYELGSRMVTEGWEITANETTRMIETQEVWTWRSRQYRRGVVRVAQSGAAGLTVRARG
jgi:hypothetical protein